MIVPDADLKFARNSLIYFTQNAALSRSIRASLKSPLMWRLMQGNAYDAAVLNWCVLFGSDHKGNQPLHWKNMFDPDSFRTGLHDALSIPTDDWVRYQAEVANYRNELVAHRDLDPDTRRYPPLDIALEAACHYASLLVPRLIAQAIPVIVLPHLKDHFALCLEKFTEQATECMSCWITETTD